MESGLFEQEDCCLFEFAGSFPTIAAHVRTRTSVSEGDDGCSAEIQAACCICKVHFSKKTKNKKREDWETAGASLRAFEKSSYQNLKIPVVLPSR